MLTCEDCEITLNDFACVQCVAFTEMKICVSWRSARTPDVREGARSCSSLLAKFKLIFPCVGLWMASDRIRTNHGYEQN